MKAPGIVRKLDDLGRIIIPKEIRKTMRIECGDPLEIFINSGGGITLRKFDPYDMELWNSALTVAEALVGKKVALYNKDGDKLCGDPAFPDEYSSVSAEIYAGVSIPELASGGVIGYIVVEQNDEALSHLTSVKKAITALMNK